MSLWTIFLTGLITGGLTCLAVQGGLLAATIAQQEEESLKRKALSVKREGNILPILFFLIAKLIAYTILGFLLGAFGSLFELSLMAKVVMQTMVGIFMIGTALNLLQVHPIFRYFVIQPPKFLVRLLRNQAKSQDFFAPAILGAFTVFIPCGTTQAMMALAIGSANPILGTAIMFTFVLGTSPTFFILGILAAKLGDVMKQSFTRVAGAAIILLAVFNINTAVALTGSSFTLENLLEDVSCTVLSICNDAFAAYGQVKGVTTQEATINLEETGYRPNSITVRAGTEVTLNLVNTKGKGCIQSFTIPKLGIQKVIRVGTSDKIQFTAPKEPGNLVFMCGMGMYRGNIKVI